MTFRWERRHSVVFVVLLACQVFGVWAIATRGVLATSRDGLRGLLMFLPGWIIGSAFLTSIIIVRLCEVTFPRHWSAKSALGFVVFWLVCIGAGVLLWRVIR
jgi:hypothetical protein